MMTKKPAKKGMIPAGYANGGKAKKEMKEEGKGHAKKEMAALKKGGASKKIMMSEAKEYGMKMANGGKAFKPCAGCPAPKKCAAIGKCMKAGK
jgi:hypothetical protein